MQNPPPGHGAAVPSEAVTVKRVTQYNGKQIRYKGIQIKYQGTQIKYTGIRIIYKGIQIK